MVPKAVLVGMPGSGKSTIGRRLAKALQVPMLDTDVQIVETTGRSIADIFAEGEPVFRKIEADVIREALAEHDGVVSLGGGAVTTPEVREALIGHTVVYLEISASEGVRRTAGGGRPLLAGDDPGAKYRELMAQRVPLFRQVATLRVNTNRRNPGAVVRHIVHRLDQPRCDEPSRRRRRSAWRRLPTVLNPGPTTEAPPSPAALAKRLKGSK
ncbi:shikimate kinase [Mycobacterium sp. CBMA293]|uniref:shikimate kinase n=1 Tax=unclassified Mycolicibacterium TaxID=2636767 RepID=UPI0012DCF2E4|nr:MULTISPECIES: shikimate kinase [unclassified Mycolicibacterium]MUL48018.1 shikimate kinase [Mycolicibacterium sp. CBMA 360]MUL58196.1 shikimate kinase [Mycolicibacterium sp. CBMA 335]MUL73654.1 shikimate kinase [Mycolicibacterium sp. CBMA 311]MUL93079.1 shikimate kinase [Mycolicibacterium sp. CBMA 230]MUM07628.1 shikimate kinase [Mycolicibacterium sp. CBMA 213]